MFLGAAAVLSAGTVYMTQQWLQGQLDRAAQTASASKSVQPAAAQVLVASRQLPAGTILKPADVRWQPWPAQASTAGYLTSASTSPAQIAGAVARADLVAGEPLTAQRVVQPGERGFLAAVLKPGYRAVTINVSASTGVAGFIFPGDRVDLVLSRQVGADQKRHVSETVLTDVRVVGIDQRSSNPKSEVVVPQTATLEVTPKQAEVVTLLTEMGKLSLSLRSLAAPGEAGASQHAVSRTWDHEATFGGAPRATPAASNSAPSTRAPRRSAIPAVEVIRGSTSSTAGVAE
jgi:pilus assembly protein CpaB